MRYFMFYGGNGYCGCDFESYEAFDDDVTEEELAKIGYELARENAETYAYVVDGEDEQEKEFYYENAVDNVNWDEISEEEYQEYR